MTRSPFTPRSLPFRSTRRFSRRGSVYILVLATATIAAAAALGAVAISQSAQRTTLASSDWNRATLAAESGLELALARINQDSSWKSSLTSGTITDVTSVGGAGARIAFVDEADGNFATGSDPVRVYASATVGSSTRVLSVLANQITPQPLDALRCALHAAQPITVNESIKVAGGPLSSNTSITVNASIEGSLEAPVITGTGSVRGFVTSPSPVKPMPSNSHVQPLINRARSANLFGTSPTLTSVLWSTNSSPLLVTNSEGLYYITVSPGQNVTIRRLRVRATVIINLPASSSLTLGEEVLWEPASPTLPSLIVIASPSSQITFTGSTSRLSEWSPFGNFNPSSTPYNGVSDSDFSDSYPSELTGVFHILGGSASVTVNTNTVIRGSLISESPITINDTCTLTGDSSLVASPPTGYTNPGSVLPVRGSYRWETAASFRTATGQEPASPTGGSSIVRGADDIFGGATSGTSGGATSGGTTTTSGTKSGDFTVR
jgi:hypothetical protein